MSPASDPVSLGGRRRRLGHSDQPRLEDAVFEVVSRTASAVGEGYFSVLVEALCDVTGCDAAFVIELHGASHSWLHPLAVVHAGKPCSVEDHPIEHAAARGVFGGSASVHATNARRAFPDDPTLAATTAEGCLIIPLRASDGSTNGCIGVADAAKLADPLPIEAILRLVEPRASAEVERLQQSAQLREQAATMQALIDHADDMIMRTRPGNPPKIEYVNSAFERFTGYTTQELYDDATLLLRLADPGMRDDFAKMLIESDVTQPTVWRWIRKDGSTLWTEGRRRVLFDDDGNVSWIESFGRDITAQKEAEERAAKLERTERLLLSAVPDAVVRVNRHGTITDCTYAHEKQPPFDAECMPGANVRDLFDPETSREVMRRVGAALASEAIESMRFRRHTPEMDRVVEVRVAPLDDDEAVLLFRDMTGEDLLSSAGERDRSKEELEGKAERRILRRNPYNLTFREFTVLELVAAGLTDKQIATQLSISLNTVGKHVSNILGKMLVSSRTEASVRAVQEHLLD